MDVDVNELFKDSFPIEDMTLDIDTPKPQKAIICLPDGFQIKTMSDIRTLEEVVSHN